MLETAKERFLFRVTPAAREFLLREGTDMKYGARHLKRTIERHLVYPLACLLATDQVSLGDVISIDWNRVEAGLKFSKEAEVADVPAGLSLHKTMNKVLAASCCAPGIVSPQTAPMRSVGWYIGCDVQRHKSSMHGQLWATSNAPKGAVFSFTLPVGAASGS